MFRNDMFVELIGYMGSDRDIADAARVSVQSICANTESPRRLIRYLMRHRHTSPFEMVETKWRIQCPIFIARQMLRHRTASVNEISGRYSELPSDVYMPSKDRLKAQDPYNKQQSSDEALGEATASWMLNTFTECFTESRIGYEGFLANGLSRETARGVLPMAQYTEFIFKIDLHNLFHFLKLRLGKDAQAEVQSIAQQMLDQVRSIVPNAVEAWEDYVLNATTFTSSELSALLSNIDISKVLESYNGTQSEIREFERKLIK